MKYFIFFLSFFIYVNDSQANLGHLVDEYLELNSFINKKRNNLKLYELDYKAEEYSKSWLLSASMSDTNSNLEESLTFLPLDQKDRQFGLGLKKETFWGGEFSFSSSYITTELTSIPKTSYFSQTLSYSQDLLANFLGRNDKSKREEVKELSNNAQNDFKREKEIQALHLINLFLTNIESKRLVDLYKKALLRSKKRERVISRRVKDGLSFSADLFSAQSSTLLKNEDLENKKLKYKNDLSELSQLFHRQISDDEVRVFSYLYIVRNDYLKNRDLITVRDNIKVEKLRLRRIKNSLLPELKLLINYMTNDYDSIRSEVISNGNILGSNHKTSAGLELNWQIGSNSAKTLKEKSFIRMENLKYSLRSLQGNLKMTYELLVEKLRVKKANVLSGKKRLSLAKEILKEYNKLYKNSKADLDQIIRAEENLIETQKGLLRAGIEIQRIKFSIAMLNAELLQSLVGNIK